jgi:hypothetical protein
MNLTVIVAAGCLVFSSDIGSGERTRIVHRGDGKDNLRNGRVSRNITFDASKPDDAPRKSIFIDVIGRSGAAGNDQESMLAYKSFPDFPG